MQRVGPAARDHVDVATERTAEFRVSAGGDHLELLHHVESIKDAAQAGGIIIGRQTIDDEVVGEVALAAHRDPLPRHGRRFRKQLVAGGVGGRHAGHQQRQVEEVAAVQRQVLHLHVGHGAGNLGTSGFKRRHLSTHHHGRFSLGHGQRDGHVEGGTHGERHASRGRRESHRRRGNLVGAHAQVGKAIPALAVGLQSRCLVGGQVSRGNGRACHYTARGVGNAPAHTGVLNRFLPE